MKKNEKYIFLILVSILTISVFFYQINAYKTNPGWDESWHLMITLSKYYEIKGINSIEQLKQSFPIFAQENSFYPPLYHILTLPVFFIFPPSYTSAMYVNLVFYLVLVISSYMIGKKLKNYKSGLTLALLLSLTPVLNKLFARYMIDLALLSILSVAYLLLIYTKKFSNIKHTLLFGLVSGLGMLTKWTFFFYLLAPIYFNLPKEFNKNVIKNIALGLMLSLIIFLPWYLSNIDVVIPELLFATKSQGDPSRNSIEGWLFYIKVIFKDYNYLLIFFGLSLFTKKKRHNNLLLNCMIIYLFFTYLDNKDYKYIVPMYLFITMYTAVNIDFKKVNLYYFIPLFLIFPIFMIESQGYYEFSPIMNSFDKNNFSVCVISENDLINDVNVPFYLMLNNKKVTRATGNGCNPLIYDYIVIGQINPTWRSKLFLNSKKVFDKNIDKFLVIYQDKEVSLFHKVIT